MDKILKRMGYRLMANNIWGKPYGYQILLASKNNDSWTLSSHFKGVDDKLYCWDKESFTDLDSLMYAENCVIHIVGNGVGADFSFLTVEDCCDL